MPNFGYTVNSSTMQRLDLPKIHTLFEIDRTACLSGGNTVRWMYIRLGFIFC